MATFKNLNQLAKYLSNQQGTSQLINMSNIKQALQREAERLQHYLIEEIDKHYMSFQPEYYHRTGAWLESITVNPIQQVGNMFIISITFDDEFAFHPSVVEGGEDGYIPWLMELGWKDRNHQTPHFDGFQGTHYIKNAVERWTSLVESRVEIICVACSNVTGVVR